MRSILDGGKAGSVHVAGLDAPTEQVPNAKKIQATGVALKIPPRGQVVALATALQESGLRNLNYGDRDSLGLFQQRPSQGWGTAQQVRDPVHAATSFYTHLKKVSGWQSMTVAQAAQAVQASGFPDAYAKWESLATALQKALAKSLKGGGGSGKDTDKGNGDKADAPAGGECGYEDGSSFGPIPKGSVPKGYKIPASAPKPVRTAIRWGLGQLGTPYQWGGSCADAHGKGPMGRCDCSSLMQASYKAGGIKLSRTTYTQVKEGKAVSPERLKPGDLLFTRGSAARPEHVGMYIGHGLILQAPRTGDVTKITRLADWRPSILAARRVA
ncbi:NlpC/P60 family protein [Streptomyces reniochalinae]|uniref:NlpC/P60 family protein n=1 Tax=Streptomyces reniochalinae TaxID=2250578 RepID=A0A367EBC2_9ACTN|nr:NlpC/P60 family protein [Streptomyces reniochalinae]